MKEEKVTLRLLFASDRSLFNAHGVAGMFGASSQGQQNTGARPGKFSIIGVMNTYGKG